MYFRLHGSGDDGHRWARCQCCRQSLQKGKAHPCHKERSWKGNHEPENIVAAHPNCHRWMDQGSKGPRETTLRESPANCRDGGLIDWPDEEWADLIAMMMCQTNEPYFTHAEER